ncbi:MAG: hypothetical protein JWL82_304 [Parcubacteria group bacterium]|nr:hypothetical protein [Parcubacteria group bacterium]
MVRFLIILAVLILALSFFGISIRAIVQSPTGHDNFTFVWELIKTGWHILAGWFHVIVVTIQSVIPG